MRCLILLAVKDLHVLSKKIKFNKNQINMVLKYKTQIKKVDFTTLCQFVLNQTTLPLISKQFLNRLAMWTVKKIMSLIQTQVHSLRKKKKCLLLMQVILAAKLLLNLRSKRELRNKLGRVLFRRGSKLNSRRLLSYLKNSHVST